MNDSVDENSRLISRRTVAKTVAWAAPAVALAAASPAHAASPAQVAMIVLDASAYEIPADGTLVINGVLIPKPGETVPAGIQLSASFADGYGYSVTSPPEVTGNTFRLTVKASSGATAATLKISSWNNPAYTPGTAKLSLATPGGVIVLDNPSYEVSEGGVVSVKGTIQPPEGGAVPDDITLVASCTDGFDVLIKPLVNGSSFELVVSAASTAGTTGTVTVSSSSHSTYAPGDAALTITGSAVTGDGPRLEFDRQLFTTLGGNPVAVTGRIIMPPGMTLPADFTLVAQSPSAAWKVVAPPVITGPDTFSMMISGPVEPSMIYILLFSPNHPEFGFPIAWVNNFAQK